MNTSTEHVPEMLVTLSSDGYGRDEWGNKKLIFKKGNSVYGREEGDYFVAGKLRIPKSVIKKPDLKCEGWGGPCGRNDAWKGHMNTRYEDEESNYVILCPDCWKECNEHWKEMWTDYYSNCM